MTSFVVNKLFKIAEVLKCKKIEITKEIITS